LLAKEKPVYELNKCARQLRNLLLPRAGLALLALFLCLAPAAQAASAVEYSLLPTGSLAQARAYHSATLLPNGKVLVVGGQAADEGADVYLSSSELYDPATGTWTPAGDIMARGYHTATLLSNGMVMVVGGHGPGLGPGLEADKFSQIYDPATGAWNPYGLFSHDGFYEHTATLLNDNRSVLVVGGASLKAVIFDSVFHSGRPTSGVPSIARIRHTATLLLGGKVLLAGGRDATALTPQSSCEVYNPTTENFETGYFLDTARYEHTATLLNSGLVLVAGGQNSEGFLDSAILFNPTTGESQPTAGTFRARAGHTATLLPNGQVVVAGGYDGYVGGGDKSYVQYLQIYDPASDSWQDLGSLTYPGEGSTATLLPSGKVLMAGGYGYFGGYRYFNRAEICDPSSLTRQTIQLFSSRGGDTATLLATGDNRGKVLLVGQGDAFLFNPSTRQWTSTVPPAEWRLSHTATLLATAPHVGQVLVAGGQNLDSLAINTCEFYDPGSGAWSPAPNFTDPRYDHTATLLGDGRVLLVGGLDIAGAPLPSAEIYNPATDSWTRMDLSLARSGHTATLLPSGLVLVAGGYGTEGDHFRSAVLYNPTYNSWTPTGDLILERSGHTATLLPNGQVLVAGGGYSANPEISSNCAEIYDPATGTWRLTLPLNENRLGHRAVLLPGGKVLVMGGSWWGPNLSSAELYDPEIADNLWEEGPWTPAPDMEVGRYYPTATLLATGQVLVTGGAADFKTELYDPQGWASGPTMGPTIDDISNPLVPGSQLGLTGTGFRGISEASGGATNSSATNYPLVQLRRLDSGRILWLPPDADNPFTDTTFRSRAFQDFQTGHCLVTVFVNGIPSVSQFTNFQTDSATAVKLASFTAAWDKKRVVVEWETYTEKNNNGFHLWRTEAGQDAYTRLTQDLIPAKGSATMGATYSYADYAAARGREYLYKLEDADRNGTSTFHGPVSATAGAGGGKGKKK
jgi:N-acetylneuraminic acid mutarotase